MEIYNINIRRARQPDIEDIFWLLHSESIPWKIEQIQECMSSLYVMTRENKLIGVSYCDLKGNRTVFHWTAIHPMYPEQALTSILHNSLINIGFKLSSCKLMPYHA